MKGVPNRITLEKARQALEEVDRLKRQGKLYKLGKDRAQDIDDRAWQAVRPGRTLLRFLLTSLAAASPSLSGVS